MRVRVCVMVMVVRVLRFRLVSLLLLSQRGVSVCLCVGMDMPGLAHCRWRVDAVAACVTLPNATTNRLSLFARRLLALFFRELYLQV